MNSKPLTGFDIEQAPERTTYESWVGGRVISSLGTNDGAPALAFQQWHKFKEAFTPELVARAVAESKRPVVSTFDPFGGSGTTALTSQFLGLATETVEINPFLADVIRAKLAVGNPDKEARALAHVRSVARRRSVAIEESFPDLPPTFLPPGRDGRSIYSAPVAARLAALISAINSLESADERQLFRVILGGILVEVSNVVVNGKGRRYRKIPSRFTASPSDVDALFAQRAERAISERTAFSGRPRSRAIVRNADARDAIPSEQIDLCVFSPPYPNSFDYTDVYNIELWVLGYLRNKAANAALRRSTLSSHVQISRDYAPPPRTSPTLCAVLEQLEAVRSDLWSSWIPSMVGAYFSDILTVLRNVRAQLSPDGQVWMVVGDSRYSGITVPVATIVNELSAAEGWAESTARSIRHMRSSAQQGGVAELPESLVVLTN